MKKSRIILCSIIICLLLGIIAMLILLLLSGNNRAGQNDDSAKKSDITASTVTTATAATSRTVDPNSFEYWVSQQMASTNITTATTTTKESTEDNTTKRSWFTAYTGSITVEKETTISTTTTTTTTRTTRTPSKTTRLLTEIEKQQVYDGVRKIVTEKYRKDREILLQRSAEIDKQIAQENERKEGLYNQLQRDLEALYERFEHGFFPIGSMESSLYNAYQNNVSLVDGTIASLESEKREIQATLDAMDQSMEEEIMLRYYEMVEELQRSTLS